MMMPADDDYATELRGDYMRMYQSRDPIAWVGIGVTIVANLVGLAWIAGRFDQRMTTAEQNISKLERKAEKDAMQDVQIAVISEQLAAISAGVGEIKARLEGRR